MWRSSFLFIGIIMFTAMSAFAQFKKHFYVENSKDIKEVKVNLRLNSGTCIIKSSQEPGVFHMYGRTQSSDINHQYNKEILDGTCYLNLILDDNNAEGLSQSISSNIFGEETIEINNHWKILLSQKETYSLHLKYGIGRAHIDLSNLNVEKFKLHSGRSDVTVGYFSENGNQTKMDTMYLKVDLGTVKATNLGQARSKVIMADVGFGNLLIDLSELEEKHVTNNVKANVGAGNLYIGLPKNNVPIKIKLKNSWLCSVNLPSDFIKLSDNIFVNQLYKESETNAILIDVNVSMGSLIFK